MQPSPGLRSRGPQSSNPGDRDLWSVWPGQAAHRVPHGGGEPGTEGRQLLVPALHGEEAVQGGRQDGPDHHR